MVGQFKTYAQINLGVVLYQVGVILNQPVNELVTASAHRYNHHVEVFGSVQEYALLFNFNAAYRAVEVEVDILYPAKMGVNVE